MASFAALLVSCQAGAHIENAKPAQIVPPEQPRWIAIMASELVCAVDERELEWCWDAQDLDGKPFRVSAIRQEVCSYTLPSDIGPGCRLDSTGAVVCAPPFLRVRRPRQVELGSDDDPAPSTEPIVVPELRDAAMVRTQWHPWGTEACTVTTGGRVRCAGPLELRVTPDAEWDARAWFVREIPLVEPAITLELAVDHGCALHASGHVSCWTEGELIEVAGFDDAREIVVGDGSSCAIRARGRLSCWPLGANAAVELRVPSDTTSGQVIPRPALMMTGLHYITTSERGDDTRP